MYALPRGPRKIVSSTRRGPRGFAATENLRNQHDNHNKEVASIMSMSTAKPIFNHNGRTRNQPRTNIEGYLNQHHQESAHFLEESWKKTLRDYKNSKEGGPEWYRRKESNPALESFKKFDLEFYKNQKRKEAQLKEPHPVS